MKTSKKIISLLMCMLMVLTIVPMSVFATVGPTEIDTVHIEGIPVPLYGQTVKEYNTVMYNGSMDGTHKINGSTRVNNGEDVFYGNIELGDWEYYNSEKSYIAPSSADALPSVYYLVHWFNPAAGYKFPDDVAVTVDGAVSVETELDEDGCLTVWAKFEIAPPTEIDTVHIEGVLAPQYGQTIKSYYEAIEAKITDGTITVNDEVYDSTAYKYGNLLDDGWNVRSDADGYLSSTSTDLIKEGTYYVAMWFLPDNGYVIPEDVNVIFDGAKSVKIEVEDDGCLDIRAEYEVKCPHVYDNACDAECNLCPETRTAPHTYESVITKATLTADGKIESKCSACGDVESTEVIAKIKSVTLSAENYIYDGKNKTPKVTVKDADGNTLVKNTDYKLSVASKRSGIGRYTVKVTFIGNYSGTKSVYFYIKTGKPATVKSASQTTSSVKLSWSAVPGASGYTVYRYSPSKKAYVKAGTTEGTSFTVKSLYAGTKYTFRVVSYGKTTAGKVYDSDSYALLKTATKTKTPTLSKVTTTKGKAVITHTNVSGETGYTVYYSTKKDSGFKKYANFKADTTRCDITKLTSGKTYYFKVRTYITTDSGYVYSAWSAVKSVKTK